MVAIAGQVGAASREREEVGSTNVTNLSMRRERERAGKLAGLRGVRGKDGTRRAYIDATAGNDWTDPAYDAAGNMRLAPRPGSEHTDADALLCVYDGWGRLVKVYADSDSDGELDTNDDTLISTHYYDGVWRG